MSRPRARLLAVVLAVGAAAASGLAVAQAVTFARRVLTPSASPEAEVHVVRVTRTTGGRPVTVTLQGPDTDLPGRYSLLFDGGEGHARLGPLVDRARVSGSDRVVRTVNAVDRGELRDGAQGRVTGWWYTSPYELGFPVEEVEIPLEDGPARAWLVRPDGADRGRWAIHVHGRGALPEETLRGVVPAARAGMTSLVLRYRNDPGAPPGLRGRYGLGLAERHDVDAAIAWARRQGATQVTLFGWSMGGTAALLSATRGPNRSLVNGLVLDSPALDWRGILRSHARLARAPRASAELGLWFLARGVVRGAVPWQHGTELAALDAEAFAPLLRVPVLIHASPDDTFVPWDGSVRLAELRPDLVRLRETRGEHVKLWNIDPDAWEHDTEEFLRALEPAAGSGRVTPTA